MIPFILSYLSCHTYYKACFIFNIIMEEGQIISKLHSSLDLEQQRNRFLRDSRRCLERITMGRALEALPPPSAL